MSARDTGVESEWIKVSTTRMNIPIMVTDVILDLVSWKIRYI